MPRKRISEHDRSTKGQWPVPSVWGHRKPLIPHPVGEEHVAMGIATDRWFGRRDCDKTCTGPWSCANLARLSRIRAMYGRRRR